MTNLETTGNMEVIPTHVSHEWNLSMDDEEPGVFSFAGTESARVNGNVRIFWSYPRQPLTLVIETPYTDAKQPFRVNFVDHCLEPMAKVSQMIDGKEVEKRTNDERASLSSDSRFRVVVKLVPPEETAYGCYVTYNSVIGG